MEFTLVILFVSITLLFHQQACSSQQQAWHGEEIHLGQEEAKLEKATKGSVVRLSNGTEVEVFPMYSKQNEYGITINATKRRQLSPFQLCSVCKCCDDTQTVCMLSACCFSIVCNSPNQPFGLCSLSPSACNCMSCP